MHHALLTLLPLLVLAACATGPGESEPAPVDDEATALFFDEAVRREERPRRRPRFEDRLRPVPPSEFRVRGAAARAPSVRDRLARAQLPGIVLRDESSLRAAAAFVGAAAGVNVVVDREAEEAFLASGLALDLVVERPLRASTALDLIVELAGDDVAWTVRDGVVIVGSPARTRGPRTTSAFEVSDLVRPVRSFAAPEIGVAPSGGFARDFEDPAEGRPVIDEAGLEDLIRATIASGTWDEDGNSIAVRGGRLIVTHD